MIKNTHKERMLMYGAILAPSLIVSSGKAITPALPSMMKSFPNVPITMFDMISTVQQLSALITLFLSIWIARKISMKKTIGIGIFITAVCGIMPAFSHSFMFILLSRFAWGIGLGLLNSLAIDAINIFFRHRENLRIRMSGYRTAMEPLGQCVPDILMGLLVMINWQVSFLAYGLIFIILIYFWKCFPSTNNEAIKRNHKTPSISILLPTRYIVRMVNVVLGLFVLMIFIVMANASVFVEVPNLMHYLHLGTPGTAGVIIGLNTIFAFFANASFGRIFSYLHRYTIVMGIIMITLGTFVESISANVWMLTLGAILSGMAFPMFGTYSYALVGKVIPVRYETAAIAFLITGSNIGSFLVPIGIHYFGIFLNPTTSLVGIIRHAFLVMSIISLILVITMTAYQAYVKVVHNRVPRMGN